MSDARISGPSRVISSAPADATKTRATREKTSTSVFSGKDSSGSDAFANMDFGKLMMMSMLMNGGMGSGGGMSSLMSFMMMKKIFPEMFGGAAKAEKTADAKPKDDKKDTTTSTVDASKADAKPATGEAKKSRLHTVGEGGEKLHDIAKQQLGIDVADDKLTADQQAKIKSESERLAKLNPKDIEGKISGDVTLDNLQVDAGAKLLLRAKSSSRKPAEAKPADVKSADAPSTSAPKGSMTQEELDGRARSMSASPETPDKLKNGNYAHISKPVPGLPRRIQEKTSNGEVVTDCQVDLDSGKYSLTDKNGKSEGRIINLSGGAFQTESVNPSKGTKTIRTYDKDCKPVREVTVVAERGRDADGWLSWKRGEHSVGDLNVYQDSNAVGGSVYKGSSGEQYVYNGVSSEWTFVGGDGKRYKAGKADTEGDKNYFSYDDKDTGREIRVYLDAQNKPISKKEFVVGPGNLIQKNDL